MTGELRQIELEPDYLELAKAARIEADGTEGDKGNDLLAVRRYLAALTNVSIDQAQSLRKLVEAKGAYPDTRLCLKSIVRPDGTWIGSCGLSEDHLSPTCEIVLGVTG